MNYLVVGKGIYGRESLNDLLYSLGFDNPSYIINQASKGRYVSQGIRILAMRSSNII